MKLRSTTDVGPTKRWPVCIKGNRLLRVTGRHFGDPVREREDVMHHGGRDDQSRCRHGLLAGLGSRTDSRLTPRLRRQQRKTWRRTYELAGQTSENRFMKA